MEEKFYKVGDIVPKAGKYQCSVCEFTIEFLPKHLEHGVKFPVCHVCKAGAVEGGPRKPDEYVWKEVK